MKIINGLIVSAGFSSRMGKFKPLLNFQGKPFIINIVDKLLTVCDKVSVVTGFNHEEIEKLIEEKNAKYNKRVYCDHNSNYELGMFGSIKTGLNSIAESEWVLYHLVDQPNLPQQFYAEFISRIDNSFDWIQPTYQNQKGHPILFNKKVIKEILCADIKSNLRAVSSLERIKIKLWECNYNEILTDIDFPKDYKIISE